MGCVNETMIRSRRRGGLGGQATISCRVIAIVASVSNFAVAASLRSQELQVEALRTEYQQNPVGLDVGTKAVKAVELTWSGGLVITGFGYAELPSPDAVPDTVARLFQENEFHTRRVVTAVSGKSVIVRYLTMFKMSPEDLRNAIRYEADKYIPFDVEEVVLDCQPFEAPGLGEVGPNEMRVLLVACKRALIDEQLRVLAGVGLQPEIVDVDVFALGNAFEATVRPCS